MNQTQALLRKHLGRLIVADTLAFFLYNLVGSIIPLLVEPLILNMGWSWKWLGFRGVYNIVLYSFAYFCAGLTKHIESKLSETSKHPFWEKLPKGFRKGIADGLALSAYRIPIYVAVALVFKVSGITVLKISTLYFIENMCLGWIYGKILDWAHRRFAVNCVMKKP